MDGLRFRRDNIPEFDLTFLTTRGTGRFRTLVFTPISLVKFGIKCAQGQFDLVHINLSVNASAYRKFAFSLVCRMFDVPYVLHLHGSDFHIFWASQKSIPHRVIDRLFLDAAAVIVLGQTWKNRVLNILPEISPNIEILLNASELVAPSAEKSIADDAKIIFLGILGPRKGSRDLLSALKILGTDTRWTATLAGDGEIGLTRQLIDQYGLAFRVEAPGWVGPEAVRALLSSADILVLPSYEENLPMSVVEGFAAGLAVITTPVGAVPDILEHDVEGLLVAPGDVEALAAALRSLIVDPALRARLGRASKDRHDADLNMETYPQRLAAIWRRAASRPQDRV
jgi:glycosyltransferase involved in cell wall biosynthesis